MYLKSIITALAAATLAVANTVTFVSQDSTSRTVIFTPSPPHAAIPELLVQGNGEAEASFPDGWIGNWFAVSEDAADSQPGMLGEVAFQGWGGMTYFDVSAIVGPGDHVGVKEMWPKEAKSPVSGCAVFPCNDAYYLPDDVQTKVTTEVDLVCTLGG